MNRYYLDVNEDLVGVPDEVVVDVGGGRDGGEKFRCCPGKSKQTNGTMTLLNFIAGYLIPKDTPIPTPLYFESV